MRSGIYQIKNLVNGKIYIGSAVDIVHRWQTHEWRFNNGSHANKYMQSSWNKYGGNNFEFSAIEMCLIEDLEEKEQYWIKTLDSNNRNFGYNLRLDANSNRGLKASEESKRLRSERMKNFKHSEESKAKMKESQKNKSKETRAKLSASKMGHFVSEETKKKIGDANRGRRMPNRKRKSDIWPCPAGSKCGCDACKKKRAILIKNWRREKSQNSYKIIETSVL